MNGGLAELPELACEAVGSAEIGIIPFNVTRSKQLRAVAAAAPPSLQVRGQSTLSSHQPIAAECYCRCISEQSIRLHFTTGPSDRCSSGSSGTDSPAERLLSQPHIVSGIQSLSVSESAAAGSPCCNGLKRHVYPQCTAANRAKPTTLPLTTIAPTWVVTNV